MMSAMRADGPTLTLRLPEPRDAPALYALASDPEVVRFFSWRYAGPQDAERWIASRERARAEGQWLEWVVEHREHGVAGVTGLTEPSARDARAVTGTWLGRAFWGTGVNTEAKALLARLAFDGCGLRRLGAYASTRNVRSQRALEKAGFVREGTLRHFHRHGDEVHDVHLHALLHEDFARGPLAAVPATLSGGGPPASFAAAGR